MRNTILVLATAAVLSYGTCFGSDAEGSFERTLNVTGPVDLDLQTSSGRLEVRADTGYGRMQLDAIRGNLDAHTGSGSINGVQIGGRIVADTGSGSVELEQTDAADIRARTGSGGITIHTAAKAGFELRAHTG